MKKYLFVFRETFIKTTVAEGETYQQARDNAEQVVMGGRYVGTIEYITAIPVEEIINLMR